MFKLKRVLLAVSVLLVALVVVVFVLENRQPVPLTLLGWSGPPLPIAVIAVGALLTGMLMGPLLGWFVGRVMRTSRRTPV
jgi:uncharacterized integral membrane protein